MKTFTAAISAALLFTAVSCSHHTDSPTAEEYLGFLYESMPVNDSIDYSRDFWMQNVEAAMQARSEMPWGASVPEREFRHFVLPVRVNNENLDSSRVVFYRELAPRIKNMTMEEAVLEVNHWLHEKATYAPSDARTSSPLATVKTTLGRCGEESTLGVAAFRSVGIPARQVYTPRWAHTDDNHAWVEVWIDGKWHFLGACEPEPIIDMAWFNGPAARGMLMATNAFGKYDGPEQQLYSDSCFTRINVTSNYAPVHKSSVQVLNPDGTPAAGAEVSFRLYNYAEFFPLFTTRADADGRASLECGKGNLIVWARNDNGDLNYAVAGPDDEELTLTLLDNEAFKASMPREMTVTPPATAASLPNPTAEQIAENNRRKLYEDSIRNARMATFFNDSSAAAFVATLGPTAQKSSGRIAGILTKTYGNGQTWTEAFSAVPDEKIPDFIGWADNLTVKDLRDITPEVIADAFTADRIVNPRISNEQLTPFNGQFDTLLPEELATSLKADPTLIPAWIKENISDVSLRNPNSYPISPAGVLRSRMADSHSRDIFFVALCRYLGIPAQIDPVTGKTQWNIDGKGMRTVALAEETASPNTESGTLRLTYPAGQIPKNPGYFYHFTLSKIENGKPNLLDYAEYITAADFAKGMPLEPGEYILTTGRRLADGGVLVRSAVVEIEAGKTTTAPLTIVDNPDELSVVGSVNADPLLPVTGRGFFIYAIVSPGHEPTQHFLNELKENKEAFEAWGKKIVLIFPDADSATRLNDAMKAGLPENVVVVDEPNPGLFKDLAKEFEFRADVNSLPVIIVGDTFNRVIFHSEGYLPGLGHRLTDIVSRLKE